MAGPPIISEFVAGTFGTVKLAAIGWIFGLPSGFILGVASQHSARFRAALGITSSGVVAIPALAILFWLHYPLQSILGVVWPAMTTTSFLLAAFVALNSGEILASEMSRLATEFIDTALVLGLRQRDFTYRVLLLGAVENGLPRFLGLAIVSIHMTMFASLIGVEELFRVTQRLNAFFLRPVELYSAMAAIYAVMCVPLHILTYVAGRRLEGARRSA